MRAGEGRAAETLTCPLSPPLVDCSAAVQEAREKGDWVRSDERRAAQGLELLYALTANAPPGPAVDGGVDAPPGPTSSPWRNNLLQIPAFLGVCAYYCRTYYKAVCGGGKGTVKDMCYEVPRAEACVD